MNESARRGDHRVWFRPFVAVAVAVAVMLVIWHIGDSKDTAKAAFVNGILGALTFGFVCLQLLLTYEQAEIAKRQTAILERQDTLLYGVAALTLYSPDAAAFGEDELLAAEQVRLIVINSGTRLAKNIRIRLRVPTLFEPGDSAWRSKPDPLDSRLSVWERVDAIAEVAPGVPVSPVAVSFRRLRFDKNTEPLLWSIVYDGGVSPPLGDFAELARVPSG